ncbi:hypothetical protein [Nocardiopsis nanhaiensis]
MSADHARGSADGLLGEARAVADAVLYEGYLLYPYRASSAKNRVRWQFGVLGPEGADSSGAGEGSAMATDCLLQGADDAEVGVRARFLQLQARTVERYLGDGRYSPVSVLDGAGGPWLSWDEAVDREVDLGRIGVGALRAGAAELEVGVPGGVDVQELYDGEGALVGRVVRRRWPLSASLRLSGVRHERSGNEGSLHTVRLELTNTRTWPLQEDPAEADRQHADERSRALRYSLISAHLTLQAFGGRFVSVIDPPEAAQAAARECRSHRLWPVLIGGEEDNDVVLAAPIILYDRPRIAANSTGDLFDSTEIDELLSLRVMTLTDGEKREARATDPRAAEIVDRCDGMSAADLEGMHASAAERLPRQSPSPEAGPGDAIPVWATPGAPAEPEGPDTGGTDSGGGKPWWDPGVDASVDPATDTVEVGGVPVARDSTVRLRPGSGADAQDLFFAGQVATVTGVHHDVDGQTHIAVVLRDDPASDLHQWYGRYLYFRPDEVEPLGTQDSGPHGTGRPEAAP